MELKPKVPFDSNLKDKFEQFIEENGYYVVLCRPKRPFHCSCWNENTREANAKCPICFGTSFEMQYERHKTRDSHVIFDASAIVVTHVGSEVKPTLVYYLKTKAAPAEGMLIIRCDWNGLYPIKTNAEVFQINSVDKMIGKQGQLAYYKVGVEAQPQYAGRLDGINLTRLKVVDV